MRLFLVVISRLAVQEDRGNYKLRKEKNSIYRKYIKRGLDFSISLIGLVLFWWVFVIIAVLVKIKLGSPVLYSVNRPGLGGKLFRLYKFRSMTNERDPVEIYCLRKNVHHTLEVFSDLHRWTKFQKSLLM